ncbi:MAG: aminotransferase class III-fold pyridoxal phosphate-dependent enzyme [Rhodospirillales bacterium]
MSGRVSIVIQARMGSSRLPGKVMKPIGGRPVIDHVIERAKRAERADEIWLACPQGESDAELAAHVEQLGIPVVRGDEEDVLSRFVAVAERTNSDTFVRITADCPMTDPSVIDAAIARYVESGSDYVSNGIERSFPDGLDVEVFSRDALLRADQEARHPFLRAHVTPYIHGRLKDKYPWGNFKVAQLVNPVEFSHLRWTLDEPADLAFLQQLIPALPEGYGWMDAVAYLTAHPDLMKINADIATNEGTARDMKMHEPTTDGDEQRTAFDRSNRLFERASDVIPLASQTFSKSYQQWAKGVTPLFIDHGLGCHVWDVDGNRFVDHVLGLLPVVLGHCDPDVDEAIARQLRKGFCFPLASPLEAELAELLVHTIPCAEMVRYGKNGSDATTGAVRLARAYTGRDRIVVCGYHGWHDWYIGTTTRDAGVPAATKALTSGVTFNDLNAVEDMFRDHGDDIAAVIVEPTSKEPAAPGFLEGLRATTEKHGAVLIFDEIVTGFRVSLGGAQAVSGVTPDLACFGKAMANGMPISAVVGRRDIMKGMEDIFFSATFGGETLSLAAAIATIQKLKREDVPKRLGRRGQILIDRLNTVLANAGLADIAIFGGESWWPRLSLTPSGLDPAVLTTLLRQEFVAHGLLIGASLNLSLSHDDDAVTEDTTKRAAAAVAVVADALNSGDPASFVRGARVQPTFAVR